MFGGLANLLQPTTIGPPPKDVPPPTPVQLPKYTFESSEYGSRPPSLVRFLQSLHRPTGLDEHYFKALGVHLHADAEPEHVIPDPAFLPPPSEEWEGLTQDAARATDGAFRKTLCNGNTSPEASVYLDRRIELSIDNQSAFRTVRRIRPEPGSKAPRLGNCYEFYRQLEQMACYWDDASHPPLLHDEGPQSQVKQEHESTGHVSPRPLDASLEQAQLALIGTGTATESKSPAEAKEPQDKSTWRVTYRTSSGQNMPAEIRHHVISAFLKLVSYDFGCNISAPRTEPRLQLMAPPSGHSARDPVVSYFPSGCVFLVRTPSAREAARSGIVEGPLAAVSARNTVTFSTKTENNIDFGREIIAALITAQHRAREGKEEKRFGDGKWWATAQRWGGGEGGPIGREIENGDMEDKDNGPNGTSPGSIKAPDSHSSHAQKPSNPQGNGDASKPAPIQTQMKSDNRQRPQSPPHPISPSSGLPMRGPPAAKKQRKGGHLSIYENYRQVRLPSATWDKKARYTAIGKVPGATHDDVFVFSSLFHHISVLRVRVPLRLLDVLAGTPEPETGNAGGDTPANESRARSWGEVEVWRSPWYDLFLAEDRLEALRLLWGVNTWMMRKVAG